MVALKKLTATQRQTLDRIQVICEMYRKETMLFIEKNNITHNGKLATASRYVSMYTLVDTHHIGYRTLKSLIAKGYLNERKTDGCGPEVCVA